MTMNRNARVPRVPTLPSGDAVASYQTYLDAQKAVDHLADKDFPVQVVTIVGSDLRLVERVTGRLSYARVAMAGLATGAWFGLFVGLLLTIFSPGEDAMLPILPAMAIGAAFGILFSVISYALTGGKRDFTSSSQIVAATYSLLCAPEHAHKARALLADVGGARQWPPPVASRPDGAADPQQPGGAADPQQPDGVPHAQQPDEPSDESGRRPPA